MHRLLRSSSVRAVQRPAFAGRRQHSSGDRVAEASTLGADDTKQQSLGIYKGVSLVHWTISYIKILNPFLITANRR